MNKEQLIQDYIANRLSEVDRKRVDDLLETDSEWKEAYIAYVEVADAFQISERDALKKRFQELDATTPTISILSRIKKRYLVKLSRMAVILVIIGLFYVIGLTNSSNGVFESYFEICPNTYMPITRGMNVSTESKEFEAFKAYETADFETSEIAFNELLKTTKNPTIRFYYAMSLLNQDKFNSALAQLKTINTTHFDYQAESLWYSALIYSKNNDMEQSKKNLLRIQELYPNFKADDVRSILNQ